MLNFLTDKDMLTAVYGTAVLAGMGLILTVMGRIGSALNLKWLRPGTWIAVFFWKLAQYAVALARGFDAFVVEYRKTKQEWEDEILNCEH